MAGDAQTSVVLFDLDGTLVDTAPEIADAVNDLLRELGATPASDAQVRDWIGEGTRVLLTRALAHAGMAAESIDAVWPSFEHHYAARCGERSTPYPGVHAALERLRTRGATLAVVTNKERLFTDRVLARHALAAHFAVVVAGDTLPVRKPDPAMVHHALAELGALGAAAAPALLIGDSAIDVRTARAACIPVWAVRHGYHRGALQGADAPDRFIDHFDQVGTPGAPAGGTLA